MGPLMIQYLRRGSEILGVRAVVARDGIEPSTFRFSVGGTGVSGYYYDSVCDVFLSKSLPYDTERTGLLRYVCEKLVICILSKLSRLWWSNTRRHLAGSGGAAGVPCA
jgi:hypothetical protein